MSLYVWPAIFAIVILIAYFSTRLAKRAEDDDIHDTGLAILEFGRAFPAEAIRDIQATADGYSVFVRLHDNKAGFMRQMRNHYACHVIEPGSVRVQQLSNGCGFVVEFLDAPFHNGEFKFATPQQAAEVSLWLLGNYVSPSDIELAAEQGSAAN